MKRLWITALLALALPILSGCEQAQEEDSQPFTLQVALVGEDLSLDPISATDIASQTLLYNLYDNLMTQTVNADGQVEISNALAKSVEETANTDATTTYTFTLRRAYWSDGELVTAQDFEYAWKRLVSPEANTPYSALLSMVAGYEDVLETGNPDYLQVTALDDDVLEVVVTGETDWFLQEVCTAIATLPQRQDVVEAENNQTLVTCGAYTLSDMDDDTITLTAFESHYGTAATADEIQVLLAPDATTAWDWYESQTVSFVWPVSDDIYTQLLEEEISYAVADLLDIRYVAINNQDEILQDSLVREALSNAVDFSAVATVAGITAQVAQGIVPEGIAEVGQDSFRQAYTAMDTDSDTYAKRQTAAQLALAQSTYPWDNEAYTLELFYTNQGDNKAIATALCQQWSSVLGLTVTPVAMDAQTLAQAMSEGSYQLALTSLSPQVNDPEPYLSPWLSTSPLNVIGYENSAYDTLVTIAATASETSGRMGCLHDAEELLLEDFALIPLYSTQTGWLLSEDMTGITRDARGWFGFATIAQRNP
ncbi:peptide ABC transporter substrate-binding protein [Bengtsoniella intestinalis]|uniref:peptide ABC transporter substrate-binding protein n=1 Tax=Bengtsoniella intestinalis TaxID=3073143 RepID=UPI00391F38CC